MRNRTLVGISIILLLACFAMSGCLYVRNSFKMHGRCLNATSCTITLVSGADSTNTIEWSITTSESRVTFAPTSGSIRPGSTINITVTVPANVCPINLSVSEKIGTDQAGIWNATLTQQDPSTQRCENYLLANPM